VPADVDQQVLIDAFVRYGKRKGLPALECIWDQALKDSVSGVTVTSVTFEGASGSGVAQDLSTAKLLAVVEQAMQIIEGDTSSNRVVHASFSGAFLQT
jgi:hypothetical protein